MMTKFLIFGLLGLAGSIIATAARDTVVSRRLVLEGKSSLALFPLFGLIAFFYPMIAIHIGGMPWYGRGIVYMAAFYAAQLLAGLGLNKINMCPWSYSGSGQIMGVVRVWDAPTWFLAGLAIEWVYPFVKLAARSI